MIGHSLAAVCCAAAALGCVYLAVAIVAVHFLRTSSRRQATAVPEPVTILKPLHGAEPRLTECLRSFCRQVYGAPVQIVFGLRDASDPALAIAKGIKADLPSLDAAIKIDPAQHGTNAKISNLINMYEAARHDILVIADSDILVSEDHITNTVALLQKPGTGAVSVLYYGVPAHGGWAELSAQYINTHFLPNVIAGLALGLAHPCFGSTIALRRETLQRIGGFEAFANLLADDYAMGAAVRKAGLSVKIGAFAAAHICHEESAQSFFRHQLRWARTIRSADPIGYAGSVIGHPFAIACLGVLLGDGTCLGIGAAALLLRGLLAKTVERKFKTGPARLWLLPITDLICFGVYAVSFAGNAVSWKKARYDVLRDGTLSESRRGQA